MQTITANLFRNGSNQAVRIPREMELPGKQVRLHKEGNKIILEPADAGERLIDTLQSLKPLDIEFPDIDKSLPALDSPEI